MVVFPEGSRTYTGKMIRFKKGAYQMALDQHLPIIPITLNGPFDVLPIGSLNVHRHRMEMVIPSGGFYREYRHFPQRNASVR